MTFADGCRFRTFNALLGMALGLIFSSFAAASPTQGTRGPGKAIDMNPENGFVGKLADGRKISVIEVLSVDTKETLYAFASDGKRLPRPLDIKTFDTKTVRVGGYVVLVRVEGPQAPGIFSVGKMEVPSQGDHPTSDSPMLIRTCVGPDDCLLGILVMGSSSESNLPDLVFNLSNTKPVALAKIDVATELVEMQGDFEGTISYTNSQKTALPEEGSILPDGKLLLVQKLNPDFESLNVICKSGDGSEIYSYPSNSMTFRQKSTMFFRFTSPSHPLKSIQIERYAYEQVRLTGLKMPVVIDKP